MCPVNLSDLSDNEGRVPPKNMTSLIQPMDLCVIATFKAYHLRRAFRHLIKGTDGEDKPAIRQFWQRYNFMNVVDNIAELLNSKHQL